MKNIKGLAVANLSFLVIHIVTSYVTNLKIINENQVGQVSDQYESLFTPAGFTFSIWGIIYAALLAFCIYHVVSAYKKPTTHSSNLDTSRIGPWFIMNNLATIAWLIAWTNNYLLIATSLIIVQLITLIVINVKTGIYNPSAPATTRWFTHFPLSIYLAWISIATIANISIQLVAIDWNGFGVNAAAWTQIMIGVAAVITSIVIFVRRNIFFGLVVIWAFYGILSKRQAGGTEIDHAIIATVIGAIVVVALEVLVQVGINVWRKRKEV